MTPAEQAAAGRPAPDRADVAAGDNVDGLLLKGGQFEQARLVIRYQPSTAGSKVVTWSQHFCPPRSRRRRAAPLDAGAVVRGSRDPPSI